MGVLNVKKGDPKKNRQERGVVYLSHIPHGFYEDQIRGYFKQFGQVTGLNLPRNKFGNAKGYAFIEFRNKEVAKIAAESMNNYLMYNRLLKAQFIEPSQQKPRIFKKIKLRQKSLKEIYIGRINKNRKNQNRVLNEDEENIIMKKMKAKEQRIKSAMKKLNIDYDIEIDGSFPKPSIKPMIKSDNEISKNDTNEKIKKHKETFDKNEAKSEMPDKKLKKKNIMQELNQTITVKMPVDKFKKKNEMKESDETISNNQGKKRKFDHIEKNIVQAINKKKSKRQKAISDPNETQHEDLVKKLKKRQVIETSGQIISSNLVSVKKPTSAIVTEKSNCIEEKVMGKIKKNKTKDSFSEIEKSKDGVVKKSKTQKPTKNSSKIRSTDSSPVKKQKIKQHKQTSHHSEVMNQNKIDSSTKCIKKPNTKKQLNPDQATEKQNKKQNQKRKANHNSVEMNTLKRKKV